jgi:MSHA biogenesis protein MshJ
MKQRWITLRDKIDAMSVRERVMIFCAAAGAIVFIVVSFVLTPMYVREKALRAQIIQQRNNIGGIDAEITAMVSGYAIDPDAPARARLAALNAEMDAMTLSMRAMESGLIAPQQIAPLLETMLKSNGRLHLVGLVTLPVRPVNESVDAPVAAPAPAAKPAQAAQMLQSVIAPQDAPSAAKAATSPPLAIPLLYRHGVELTVRGNYLDMVSYMEALETMPARVIWGKASLVVEEYPSARLTLTMYTLSLDKKWMKL